MILRAAFLAAAFLTGFAAQARAWGPGAVVNGQQGGAPQVVSALEQRLNVTVNGWVWYDPVSGLVGEWGEGAVAAISPGLPAPPLPANASGGGTRVYVNGRELPWSTINALENTYTMIVEGQYTMGPDLVMYKYPGAPGIRFAAAMATYADAQEEERQWCAMARARAQAAGPGQPVLLPDIGGSGRYSVQVTMDRNGCMMTSVQGRILSRCCDE